MADSNDSSQRGGNAPTLPPAPPSRQDDSWSGAGISDGDHERSGMGSHDFWLHVPSFEYVKKSSLWIPDGPMVEINIGTCKAMKKYLVYKNFVTYHSPVLDKAFSSKFIEGQTQVYTITDFEFPETFGMVMAWIYSQKFHAGRSGWNNVYSTENLCRVWVLGDRLLMPDMQDYAIEKLCDRSSTWGNEITDFMNDPLPLATWVCKETTLDSPLRKLFAYKCAYQLNWEQGFGSGAHQLPVELVAEIASIYQLDARKCQQGHVCDLVKDSWGLSPHVTPCEVKIQPRDYQLRNIAARKERMADINALSLDGKTLKILGCQKADDSQD